MAKKTFTAIKGKVMKNSTRILDVTKATLTIDPGNQDYASSETGGWKARLGGIKDAKGSVDFKAQNDQMVYAVVKPGEEIADLKIYLNDTQFLHGPAIVGSVNVEVDLGSGSVVGGSFDFEGDGPWADFD